jgi:hypothetical protein
MVEHEQLPRTVSGIVIVAPPLEVLAQRSLNNLMHKVRRYMMQAFTVQTKRNRRKVATSHERRTSTISVKLQAILSTTYPHIHFPKICGASKQEADAMDGSPPLSPLPPLPETNDGPDL